MLARLPEEDFSETATSVEQAAEKSGGRVCERFTIALPLEAKAEQREALVSAFAEHITKGNAGFIAAIHDKKENDLFNPHAHLICFDTFTRKGGRGRPSSVLGMARKNAVEKAAEDWARIHNRMMTDWGYGSESLIDHRSYAERGIELVPTIHEGPSARKMAAMQMKSATKPEWQHIDNGHTRAEANNLIREINKTKETLNEQRADRLGGNDDANSGRSQSRVPWLGESGRGNRGNGRTAKLQRNRVAQDPRNYELPFTSSGGQQSRSGERRKATFSNHGAVQTKAAIGAHIGAHVANFRDVRRVRVRGLRRTFRNLILYRDTLNSRILQNAAPTQLFRSAEELTSEPIKSRLPKQETR